jgi:hypothetical protein
MATTTADRPQEAPVPISKHNLEEIMKDERITPSARQLLFAIFDHDPGGGSHDERWSDLRGLLKELQDAGYLMRGDAWKGQVGGHLLLFDRWQAETVEGRLPPFPPKNFGRDVLYVIGRPGLAVVKIGVTRNLVARLKSIQTGSPIPLSVLWWHPGSYDLEEQVHREFREFRMEGEWFDFGVEEPDILTEMAVQRLRPSEFPPDPGLDESFEDYLRRYPPGCRYTHLLNLSHSAVNYPQA